jgi:hypothetical protein
VWNVIGSATFDSGCRLSGSATIPNTSKGEIGDHVIYAVSPKIKDGTTMDFWWGFFDITFGSVATASPTLSSTSAPSSEPTQHPDFCTLTLKHTLMITIQNVQLQNESYSVRWPYGSEIKLNSSPPDENGRQTDRFDLRRSKKYIGNEPAQ